MSKGQGLERTLVSTLLSGMVICGIAAGLWYAHVCGKRPEWRRATVTATASVNVLVFTCFIIWPGQMPIFLLGFLLFAVGAAGPSSMIAFDYSMQYVPKIRLGATNGFINIGGFLACFTMMFLIGLTLDLHQVVFGGELYSADGFRTAFAWVLVVIGFGLWRFRHYEKMAAGITQKQD